MTSFTNTCRKGIHSRLHCSIYLTTYLKTPAKLFCCIENLDYNVIKRNLPFSHLFTINAKWNNEHAHKIVFFNKVFIQFGMQNKITDLINVSLIKR